MDFNFFRQLTETAGVPGREEQVREMLAEKLAPLVDRVYIDPLGNVIGERKAKNPAARLMLAGHMDEIGLRVSHIDSKGFIRFVAAGGIDPRTLISQRVFIHADSGPVTGLVCIKPPFLGGADKPVPINEMFIDIGYGEKDAKRLVQLGDPVTLERSTIEFGASLITGKAMDDRAGIFIILEALRKVKRHKCSIYPVFTVQEEVGLRGAGVSGFAVEPDIALAVDVTAAADVPGCPEHEYITRFGQGIALSLCDAASVSNFRLMRFIKKLAEARKIPHQVKVANRGGTDAAAIQRSGRGVAVGTLSLPTRYIHSSVEAVSKHDIESAIDLLAAFIESCHEADYKL